MRKKNYISAHRHFRLETTVVELFKDLSAIYTKWCAQTFPSIFGASEFFPQFRKDCGAI